MAEKHVHKVYGSFPPWGKSVEFPASGGGGGGLTYFDVSPMYGKYESGDLGYKLDAIKNISHILREDDNSGGIIFTTVGHSSMGHLYAVGIDLNAKISRWDDGVQGYDGMTTIEGDIKRYDPWILELPRLTEEEFYGL